MTRSDTIELDLNRLWRRRGKLNCAFGGGITSTSTSLGMDLNVNQSVFKMPSKRAATAVILLTEAKIAEINKGDAAAISRWIDKVDPMDFSSHFASVSTDASEGMVDFEKLLKVENAKNADFANWVNICVHKTG